MKRIIIIVASACFAIASSCSNNSTKGSESTTQMDTTSITTEAVSADTNSVQKSDSLSNAEQLDKDSIETAHHGHTH